MPDRLQSLDLAVEHNVQLLVRSLIADGLVSAAHDTSEGGLLVALAEMLISAGTGATIALQPILDANDGRLDRTCFGEAASRVIVAVAEQNVEHVLKRASESDLDVISLGTVGGGRNSSSTSPQTSRSRICE